MAHRLPSRVTMAEVTDSDMGELVGGKEQVSLSPILLPFAPMLKRAMGVACGLVLGGLIWLATATVVLRFGRAPVWPNLGLLSQFFWGYRVTWLGSFIGLAWGFAIGYVFGWSFAALHNVTFRLWLALVRLRAEKEQYSNLLDRL
jgi:hypothetical protein